MTRFVLVPIIAAALTACVQPPRIAHTGMDRRLSNESPAVAVDQEVQPLHELIRQILRADYAGDRPALDRLYGEADAFLGDKAVESRVRYWNVSRWTSIRPASILESDKRRQRGDHSNQPRRRRRDRRRRAAALS